MEGVSQGSEGLRCEMAAQKMSDIVVFFVVCIKRCLLFTEPRPESIIQREDFDLFLTTVEIC